MMLFINLLEGLIAVWAVSELCDIRKKRSFIVITTLLTFFASFICDLLQWNSWPLLIAYILIWFLMASLYTKKSYLYNFFVSLVCNYIINLSVILPLLFLYEHNIILACCLIRIIQFIISFLFVLYRKRYKYIENKYWLPVMAILMCCMIILEEQIYSYFSGSMTTSTLMIIFLVLIIAGVSLMFFAIIEKIVHEKSVVHKQLERERYRNISYDIINYAKRELNYLHHGLIYKFMLIKGKLELNLFDEVYKLVASYIEDFNKYSQIITTGNEVLDLFFLINTSNINYNLIKNINIPENNFYNSLDFINFISRLLSIIVEHSTVHFILEHKGELCVISLFSVDCFFDRGEVEKIMNNKSDIYFSYDICEEHNSYLIKIIVRVFDEGNM